MKTQIDYVSRLIHWGNVVLHNQNRPPTEKTPYWSLLTGGQCKEVEIYRKLIQPTQYSRLSRLSCSTGVTTNKT